MAKVDVPGFDLLEPIGKGAGSTIYKAVETASGKTVAVKQIIAETKDAAKYLRHLENEFNNLTALHRNTNNHPGSSALIRVHSLLRAGRLRRRKAHAMVMDYIEGLDLRREHRYPVGQMAHFLLELAHALEFIHSCGLVHADVKPENIMVSPRGDVTLLDFGFSCPMRSRAKTIRGTREYMAPEQVDRGVIDSRTDLYNLGASFYFLFTGRQVPALLPTSSGSEFVIVSRDVKATPLWDLNPHVPLGVAKLIMSCVELDPECRPVSSAELRKTLQPLVETCYGEQESAC